MLKRIIRPILSLALIAELLLFPTIVYADTTTDTYTDTTKVNTSASPDTLVTGGNATKAVNPDTGTGADGAITVSSLKDINADLLASGRTGPDGANYVVTAIGTNTVTLGTGPVGFWNMNESSGTTVGDSSGNNNTATAVVAPGVSYWKMDEASGTNVANSTGSLAGTATGTTIVAGQYGNARSVSATTDMIDTASPYVDLDSTWTIEAWFQYPLASMASWNTLTRGNAGDHQIIVRRSDMHLGGYDNIGGTAFRDTGYVMSNLSNGWHHVAAVGSGGTTTYYIDGVQAGSAVAWQSTSDIRAIGNYQGGGQAWGTIDDVRIYDTARTAAQISDDKNNDVDYSIVAGKYGSARLLDGAKITANGDNLGLTQNFTVAAWVNTSDTQGVIARNGQFALQISGTNANGYVNTASSWGSAATQTTTTGTWTHYALVYNGSQLILYKNGVASTAVSRSGALTWGDGADHTLYFGTYTSPNWFLNGSIDDVRIYNYARSAGQIKDDMYPTEVSLTAGDEVMIINLQGDATNNGNVGNYEFLTIQSISGTTVTFSSNVTKIYGATSANSDLTGQKIIIQRVPQYSNVTIGSGGTMTATAWDGAKGGVLVFRANGTVSVAGSIGVSGSNASGQTSGQGRGLWGGTGAPTSDQIGWPGGSFKPPSAQAQAANGGGGGGGARHTPAVCNPSGGGGGGYGTAGSAPANKTNSCSGTAAGATYGAADLTTKLYLGSGGGGGGSKTTVGGGGGGGGGIIYVIGSTVTVTGSVRTNGGNGGAPGSTDDNGGDGGGGGSGGSIFLGGKTITAGSNLVTATGGTGNTSGTHSNAGNGGAGRIAIGASSSVSGTSNPTYTAVTPPNSGYVTSGALQSTNLLTGVTLTVDSINEFVYNLSSVPAGQSATVQFSQNATQWYNSSGQLNGTDAMSTGVDNTIVLTSLGWSGANFYYKVTLAGPAITTPTLADITLNYTPNSGADGCTRPLGGNFTITQNCVFPQTIDGVDNGNLTIGKYATLTINASQTVAWNGTRTITVQDGGIILINSAGGKMKQTLLWVPDADGDGYPTTANTQVAQDGQPTNHRRRYLMTSIGTLDCNDTNATVNVTCPTPTPTPTPTPACVPNQGSGCGSWCCNGTVQCNGSCSCANNRDGQQCRVDCDSSTSAPCAGGCGGPGQCAHDFKCSGSNCNSTGLGGCFNPCSPWSN